MSLPETEEETIDAKIRHGKDIHKKKTRVKISILLSFIVSLALFYLYGYEKNASVQFLLGLAYYNGTIGDKPDYEKAVNYYRKAAEQGNAAAQCNLGLCYEYGQGVPQDYTKAVYLYREAAEQENLLAEYNLG